MKNLKQLMSGKVVVLNMVILVLIALGGQLGAQDQFVTFNKFVAATAAASSSDYVGQPATHVQDAAAFEQMRQHILSMYQGVEVSHSFQFGGSYFDCVPISEEPSVRLQGISNIASTPPQPTGSTSDANSAQLGPKDQYDAFRNSTTCEDGTIPMQRITLEQVSRFATLQDFFSKDGTGDNQSSDLQIPVPPSHKYAYTRQTIDNLGGSSVLNLWSPNVDQAKGQVFSLSQQWYAGGDGDNTQTVEGGWQNYPGKYGDQNSRLFIFWTADNYKQAKCYNLDCPAFVQVNKTWMLGAPFDHYSDLGGTQYAFTMKWLLYDGDWWLALQNGNGSVWVGYYPGKLFKDGQMSHNAQNITYGGETVGTDDFGPMGSGAFPANGFKWAAFQRQIYYFDMTSKSKWADLTAQQPSPKCYKVAGLKNSGDTVWAVNFYFGGPGGKVCE